MDRTVVPDGLPDSASPGERLVKIRRFTAGDAPAVRALDETATKAAGTRSRRDPDLDSIATGYVEDGGEFLVGVYDGRVVAMGALRHVTDSVAELNRMRVHPAFQRRGFGRTILARLEDRAGELGYLRVRLDTPVPVIAPRRLYESAGYREVGRGWLAGAEVIYFEKTLPERSAYGRGTTR